MTATYDSIATTTLSSAASTITFSSIPNTYTDLRLVIFVNTASALSNSSIRINLDSGTNYSRTSLTGDGASANSARTTSQSDISFPESNRSTTIPTMQIWDFFSYAGSTNKTVLAISASDLNGSGHIQNIVGLWRNTAAITSIRCQSNGGTYGIGTVATLYGIKSE